MIQSRDHRQPASALLLSFFLMSLLIIVAIGVSYVVIRDVNTIRRVVAGVQAQYAAEGMTEIGLGVLKDNLPGYEPSVYADFELSNTTLASLDIHAREYTVPCSVQGENEWRVLEQNESIQIPLFAQIDEEGNVVNIQQFYVEFYVANEDGEVTSPPATDVLRWKILGLTPTQQITEAISEFIPLHIDDGRTSELNPSIFGTVLDGAVPSGYSHAKYYQQEPYYLFHAYYPISKFLEGHQFNYLVLTNVVQRTEENQIYFRLHSVDEAAVCEYITLSATGVRERESVQQSMQTYVREGENLPAFDFVLYHTEEDEEEVELSSEPVDIDFDGPLPW